MIDTPMASLVKTHITSYSRTKASTLLISFDDGGILKAYFGKEEGGSEAIQESPRLELFNRYLAGHRFADGKLSIVFRDSTTIDLNLDEIPIAD